MTMTAQLFNKQIWLANPRGFCAGVDRAIGIVERALALHGAPIYVRHEVVHNRFVVENLKQAGAVFIEELHEVPSGGIVIFSAHGVSKAVQAEAKARDLKVFDATCPLVTKVHMEVERLSKKGEEVILIGHAGHPEVEGTMGQYEQSKGGTMYLVETLDDVAKLEVKSPQNLAYVTQTTLSVDDTAVIIDALRKKYPQLAGPKKEDICYATQNRQNAVRELAKECTIILVVGSKNSSNSNRLRELAQKQGAEAYLIDGVVDINFSWFLKHEKIGITAGASAPDILVEEVISGLVAQGATLMGNCAGIEENIVFPLPKELRIP